jgi:hypothetical protein
MVACLLSHQNPLVRRIDGSGGDLGRDCQFDAPDGLHAYQIKKFRVERMGPAQRRQVRRSLMKAALLDPKEWALIVPFDHTPEEMEWFDRVLAKEVRFPIVWRGRTWLDLEFAQRAFIARYYMGDTKDEVFDLLRELREEQAALSSVPQAAARIQTLVSRANTLDPHYRFAIKSDGTTTEVTIKPAYVGAERDRPIEVSAEFRFDTRTDEGRAKAEEFERAFDFGSPVNLSGDFVPQVITNAPAGLGGTYKHPSVQMGPGKPVTDEPLDLVYTIADPQGAALTTLTLTHIPETSGRRGTILRGTDRGGYVNSEVTIDVRDAKYRIKFNMKWDTFLPHDFAPIARFLAEYHRPNTISVAKPDGTMQSDQYACEGEVVIPAWVVEFVANLAVIQASASIVREVSGDIDRQDVVNAAGGVLLLRGGEVPKPWETATVGLRASASIVGRQEMADTAIRIETTIEAPVMVDICGTTYPIGHRHRMRTVARVHPDARDALLAETLTDDIEVVLLPDASEPSAWVRLVA